jgi:hypothetical protein
MRSLTFFIDLVCGLTFITNRRQARCRARRLRTKDCGGMRGSIDCAAISIVARFKGMRAHCDLRIQEFHPDISSIFRKSMPHSLIMGFRDLVRFESINQNREVSSLVLKHTVSRNAVRRS